MPGKVEDYAVVSLALETGRVIRLACSWNISAGRDAVIESCFFGTKGGLLQECGGLLLRFRRHAAYGR